MSKEPKDVHAHDQLIAGMKQFAAALAATYHELVEQGVPAIHAATVIARMAAAHMGGAPPRE